MQLYFMGSGPGLGSYVVVMQTQEGRTGGFERESQDTQGSRVSQGCGRSHPKVISPHQVRLGRKCCPFWPSHMDPKKASGGSHSVWKGDNRSQEPVSKRRKVKYHLLCIRTEFREEFPSWGAGRGASLLFLSGYSTPFSPISGLLLGSVPDPGLAPECRICASFPRIPPLLVSEPPTPC